MSRVVSISSREVPEAYFWLPVSAKATVNHQAERHLSFLSLYAEGCAN